MYSGMDRVDSSSPVATPHSKEKEMTVLQEALFIMLNVLLLIFNMLLAIVASTERKRNG